MNATNSTFIEAETLMTHIKLNPVFDIIHSANSYSCLMQHLTHSCVTAGAKFLLQMKPFELKS